jgi:hypothetical protein
MTTQEQRAREMVADFAKRDGCHPSYVASILREGDYSAAGYAIRAMLSFANAELEAAASQVEQRARMWFARCADDNCAASLADECQDVAQYCIRNLKHTGEQ